MAEYLKQGWQRGVHRSPEIAETVSRILSDVEREGTSAVRRYSNKLDNWNPGSFVVSPEIVENAATEVNAELARHLEFARAQVAGFAHAQRATLTGLEVETLPGVVLGHRHIPIGVVGSYSPGGRYPLIASAMMTITVPKVADVDRTVAMAPPRDGKGIHPPQLYMMHLPTLPPLCAWEGSRRWRRWHAGSKTSSRSTWWSAPATRTSPKPSGSCSGR